MRSSIRGHMMMNWSHTRETNKRTIVLQIKTKRYNMAIPATVMENPFHRVLIWKTINHLIGNCLVLRFIQLVKHSSTRCNDNSCLISFVIESFHFGNVLGFLYCCDFHVKSFEKRPHDFSDQLIFIHFVLESEGFIARSQRREIK